MKKRKEEDRQGASRVGRRLPVKELPEHVVHRLAVVLLRDRRFLGRRFLGRRCGRGLRRRGGWGWGQAAAAAGSSAAAVSRDTVKPLLDHIANRLAQRAAERIVLPQLRHWRIGIAATRLGGVAEPKTT